MQPHPYAQHPTGSSHPPHAGPHPPNRLAQHPHHPHHPPPLDPHDFFATLSYSRYQSELLCAIRLAGLGAYVESAMCRRLWEEDRLIFRKEVDVIKFTNDVLRVTTMIECSVPWEVRSWRGWIKALDAAGLKNVQEEEVLSHGVVLKRPDELLRVTCAAVKSLKG